MLSILKVIEKDVRIEKQENSGRCDMLYLHGISLYAVGVSEGPRYEVRQKILPVIVSLVAFSWFEYFLGTKLLEPLMKLASSPVEPSSFASQRLFVGPGGLGNRLEFKGEESEGSDLLGIRGVTQPKECKFDRGKSIRWQPLPQQTLPELGCICRHVPLASR
jgi:hypothetical protein